MNNPRKYTRTSASSIINEPMVFDLNTIPKPHRFTLNTQSALKKLINKLAIIQKSKLIVSDDLSTIRSIYRGRLVCRNANCFHVTVSESLVNRAIHFLDTLAKELESHKFKIAFQHDDAGSYVYAVKDNEHISFYLSEGFNYQPIDNDRRSALESMLYRDRKPVPTGKLTLSISAYETNINKSWADGARPIEDALPTIIDGFESLIPRQKQRKIDNILRAKQRLEEAKRVSQTESMKFAEMRIYDNAMHETKAFKDYQKLEEYLNFLEVSYLKEFGNLDESIKSWLATARKYAETQSPIRKRLNQFRNMRISNL